MIAVAVALAFSVATTAGAPAPRPAPEFEVDAGAPSVMVATSEPGESYAIPEECTRDDVICTRFPLWFRVEPIVAVYGDPPRTPVAVTTYTHFGQPEADDRESPRLLLLLEQDDRYLMPAYASERLWRRADGQYYVLLHSPRPIDWLPCSADALREPVDAAQFPAQAQLAPDEYAVRTYPTLFSIHEGRASPRFGINVARLGRHLEAVQPARAEFECERDDEG